MALFDIFGMSSAPDPLQDFLDPEKLRQLRENAQRNAMLQFGLSALSQGGYSRTPVGLGEIIGQAGQAGLAGYQGTMDRGAQNILMQQKLAEAKKQREQEAMQQNMTEQYISKLPPEQQALVRAYPSLGAKMAEAQVVPQARKFEKVDNVLLDVTSGQPTPVYTAPKEPKEPNMTDEATRVSYALFKKMPNQLSPQEMGQVNQYIEQRQTRVAQAGVPSNQPGFENASKLRTEYNSLPAVKAYGEVQNAFDQIKTGLKSESAAGDLAAATKFMKLLDPGSVVRESELGMAMAATGVLDRANNYFKMLSTGQKLTPSQRKDFLDVSTKLYNAAKNTKNKLDTRYASIARKGGLDPELVIGRTESDIMREYGL